MKLQEESILRSLEILRNAGSPLEWEKTVPATVAKAVEAMRENAVQLIHSINKHAEQTLRHMEAVVQFYRPSPAENNQGGDVRVQAVDAMRTNVQVISQANVRVLESWNRLAAEALNRLADAWAEPNGDARHQP